MPGEIALDTVIFRVDEPVPVMLGGVKLSPIPAGNAAVPKVTVPAKPLVEVTVALNVVLPPGKTVCADGEAANDKTLTAALKDRPFVQTPSVTEIVMADEPVPPATGDTEIVRFVPLPPSVKFAFGKCVRTAAIAGTVKIRSPIRLSWMSRTFNRLL